MFIAPTDKGLQKKLVLYYFLTDFIKVCIN